MTDINPLPAAEEKPFLLLRGITKTFASVLANDAINLDIYHSEIHALLGENGAGKSTLMKILYGFYRADSGQIILDGKPLSIHTPHDARTVHIGMVFQDFNLIPVFSVAENIALFLPDLKPVLNMQSIHQRIHDISARYGLQVDPQAIVSQLSIGEQQKVEILKLLLADAQLLILDEPTRVLAPHEVQALYRVLANLRQDGYAIILITHKLKDVLECADRITVLRGGRVAGSLLRAEASEDKLVKLMFEKELSSLKVNPHSSLDALSLPVLELHGVESYAEGASTSLKGIDLSIYPGEIVGIAGVSGNGQKELCDVVLGMLRCIKGQKRMYGKDLTNLSIKAMRNHGVSFIPENPLEMASVPFMTVLENMALTRTGLYSRRSGLSMDWQTLKSDIEATATELGFPISLYALARSLSGGNLQRMVIVREMSHQPRLIIASYLTRGLDLQSTLAARQALIRARENGAGVLLISEDLEELFALSDRLLVLYDGKMVGEYKPSETNVFEIGHKMTGLEVDHATYS